MGDCFNYRLQTSIWSTGRWFFNCKKEKWHPFGWKLWPLLSEVLDRQDISCIFKLININSQGNWYAHCLAICRQRLFYQFCYFLLLFIGSLIQLYNFHSYVIFSCSSEDHRSNCIILSALLNVTWGQFDLIDVHCAE